MSEQTATIFTPLFRHLKEARTAFREHSRGELELLSSVYQGDDHRHHVYHVGCGGHSWISLQEFRSLPPGEFCPHCHGTEDLSRLGDMEHIQVSVYRGSANGAYFFGSNSVGTADQEYVFWCTRHGRSYEATFTDFRNAAGETNACPLCVEAERKISVAD